MAVTPKPWFLSTTIIGTLLGALGGLIVVVNSARPGTVPQEVGDALADPAAPARIAEWIGGAVWIAGVIMAIWGRIRAKQPIAKSVTGKLPMLLLCGVLTAGVVTTQPGCAQTQAVQYEAGPRTDYVYASNNVRDAIVLLRAALADGLISAEDWREKVNPAIQETNTAMNAWEAAVLSGRAEEIGTARVLAESLIARLRHHIATARLKGSAE